MDSETGQLIFGILRDMSKKSGQTVIVVTHNATIATAANKVIHLKDGRVSKIEINKKPVMIKEVSW